MPLNDRTKNCMWPAGCSLKRRQRGLCNRHLAQWNRDGQPDIGLPAPYAHDGHRHHIDRATADLDKLTGVCSVCGPTTFVIRRRGPMARAYVCKFNVDKTNAAARAAYVPNVKAPLGAAPTMAAYIARFKNTPDYAAMKERQAGKCAACGGSQRKGLATDHNHATGQIRELLCDNCNMAIGYLKDDPDRARAIAAYLDRHAAAPLRVYGIGEYRKPQGRPPTS